VKFEPGGSLTRLRTTTRRNRAGGGAVRIVLGGTAQVCCVHDREKCIVTTERQVAELGLEVGVLYDPRLHKLQSCACCGNLFFDPSDEPRYCSVCQGPLVHSLGGPLPEPEGVVG
jgi:hypothetical protein